MNYHNGSIMLRSRLCRPSQCDRCKCIARHGSAIEIVHGAMVTTDTTASRGGVVRDLGGPFWPLSNRCHTDSREQAHILHTVLCTTTTSGTVSSRGHGHWTLELKSTTKKRAPMANKAIDSGPGRESSEMCVCVTSRLELRRG